MHESILLWHISYIINKNSMIKNLYMEKMQFKRFFVSNHILRPKFSYFGRNCV